MFLLEVQTGVPGEGGPLNEVLNVKWYLPGGKEGKSRAAVRKHRWYDGVSGEHPILLDGGSGGAHTMYITNTSYDAFCRY